MPLLGKLKEFGAHFLASCLIILLIAGAIKYHNDTRNLNEQIYLQSKSHGKLVIAKTPEKNLLDKVLGKKKIHVSPDIPKKDISKAISVVSSTDCPAIDITVLKNGQVVSDSTGVTKILIEDYENSILGSKLDLRLTAIAYPKQPERESDWDLGLQISYWKVWHLYPDVTLARDFIGTGVSYRPELKYLENLMFGVGYGYRWDKGYWTPYASGSLRFGK